MELYHDTYAEAMAHYGLQSGIRGSEARHITTSQFYRELFSKNETLKENIGHLLQKQEFAEKGLSKVKTEVSKEKFRNAKAEMGANLMDGVNSLFGGSKVKQQQAEIEQLQSKITTLKDENRSLKTEMQTLQKEYQTTTDKLRVELKKIYDLFPNLCELLSIERMCRLAGFTTKLTKQILPGEKVGFKGVCIHLNTNASSQPNIPWLKWNRNPNNPANFALPLTAWILLSGFD